MLEDTSSNSCTRQDLQTLLSKLKIPNDYGRVEYLKDNSIPELETWKTNAITVLREIADIVKVQEWSTLSLECQGRVILSIAPFASSEEGASEEVDDWTTPETCEIANHLFSSPQFAQPPRALVEQVLAKNLKPIFKSSPHPHLNVDTGRKLSQVAGGSMALQDYYEGQVWKQYPGIGKVVLWCVRHLDKDAYENLWHLVIPPVMALLDDYEARYKLHGILVVQEMLRHVPNDLLKRTGIGGLLKQSLRASLSHLQSPETPMLLQHAINASVSLILLTTSVSPAQPSSERFDELSSLLGEGIISGIWLYSEDKADVVKATFDVLPALLNALGIGSTRFLKALISQLVHSLIPQPLTKPDRTLQLSAICALETLLDVCKPRIAAWKETILNGVGRCWVGCMDEENQKLTSNGYSITVEDIALREEAKTKLQDVCVKLAAVCPSVAQIEYKRFLDADSKLFKGLFQKYIQSSA